MTQNPLSPNDPFAGDNPLEPKRTSILAILALILSILCVTAPLGVLASIGALFGIKGSNGRVGGTGIAVAALIIGLLCSVLWVGAYFAYRGIAGEVGKFFGGIEQVMTDIDAGDFDEAASALPADQRAAFTNERFEVFQQNYQAKLGSFQSLYGGLEMFAKYGELGQVMQDYQGGQNIVPLPAAFDNGTGLVVFYMDTTIEPSRDPDTGNYMFSFSDIEVVASDGTAFKLSTAGDTPTDPPASDSSDETTGEPEETTDDAGGM